MSGDVMSFPSNWWTFVQQYQFTDKDEVYTNGSMLIPSFRVRQMVEHYFGGEVGKTSRHAELFGTPERAARTLERMDVDVFNWCVDDDGNHKKCGECPYEYDYWGCYLPEKFSMLVWLKSEVVE